ncbi:hypothetical protein SDJN02_12455 [Cucurbita argyrosperma subsp. argyrosperma]|uniref:Uncharacterized protein LOC111464393 n=2 Tax=Cucurbita TaxID=3660 RepID=A0A6J1HKK7_CUCMO
MVDVQIVCCMCGDIGFPDKLFRCNHCRTRFQHSYCSNYYTELGRADPIQVCDWCRCEGRTSSSSRSHGTSSKRPPPTGERIKQHHEDASSSVGEKGKHGTAGGVPSPKPTTRRYKLLKDVMC